MRKIKLDKTDFQNFLFGNKTNVEIFSLKVMNNIELKKAVTELLDFPIFHMKQSDIRMHESVKNRVCFININSYLLPIQTDNLICDDEVIISHVLREIDNRYNSKLKEYGFNYIAQYRVFMRLLNALAESDNQIEIHRLNGILVNAIYNGCKDDGKSIERLIASIKNNPVEGISAMSCKDMVNHKDYFIRQIMEFAITKLTTEKDALKRIYGIELEELYGM